MTKNLYLPKKHKNRSQNVQKNTKYISKGLIKKNDLIITSK